MCATQELLKLADKTAFTHCLAVVYTNHSEKEFVTVREIPSIHLSSWNKLIRGGARNAGKTGWTGLLQLCFVSDHLVHGCCCCWRVVMRAAWIILDLTNSNDNLMEQQTVDAD